MIFQRGFVILLFVTVVFSFGSSSESADSNEGETIEKRAYELDCKNHMDCFKCDEIKRMGQCQFYLSDCAKTCNPECASTPFADQPYKPCADVKANGDCREPIPHSSDIWASVCEKTCCVPDTPSKWGPWTDWGPCSRSCDHGFKTRTRVCHGAGYGHTCHGHPFESAECNNDVPCKGLVGWEKTAVTVREDVGKVTLKIIRSRITNCEASVKVSTQDGTAKQPGDYVKIEHLVVNFAKGETEKTVTFTINKDRLIEPLESFTAVITADTNNLDVDQATTTITIEDCTVKVGFRPAAYRVVESRAYVVVKVYRIGNIKGVTEVILNTNDGRAKANRDYRPLKNFPVIFAAGQTRKSIKVRIINNRVVERLEGFSIKMTTSDRDVTRIEPNVANVRIIDDDAIIGFERTQYRVEETSRSIDVVIRRSGATRFQHTAILMSRNGSASAPRDYQRIRPTVIKFAPEELRKVVVVKINDDKLEEGPETFRLVLTTRDRRVVVRPRAASVSIVDNDVNGKWSAWSAWSACGKTCGLSTKTRTRVCTPPKGDGRRCVGSANQSKQCFIERYCPLISLSLG